MGAEALLTVADRVSDVKAALADSNLDGWLLYEFHGQNRVAGALLGLETTMRRSFTMVPVEGDPVALIHAVEPSSWRHWPWRKIVYSGWRDMEACLAELLEGKERVAMEVSRRSSVPTMDMVPSGVVDLVLDSGVEIVSSGNLISTFYSAWSAEQLEEHRNSAEVVKAVARDAFERAAEAARSGSPLSEGDLTRWIEAELPARGISLGVGCIVAIGPRAADPHYEPGPTGEVIAKGELLLIDLWGKATEEGVPADQTWMGILDDHVPDRAREIWEAVRDARDAAVDFLRTRFEEGSEVKAFEIDDVARRVIEERGYGESFVHRTGHSIDRELHGSGPNLDNLETRDDRLLVPGVGFSIEPGIYLADDIGIRSEINVNWGVSGPEVTPGEPQMEIFTLL
ncbi:MAG: M24 family metallopeptidase [Gemmatimonadota bacterium]|nr:MAG: M24 family metallopeptidase [Gemmatimonadota bacterium]